MPLSDAPPRLALGPARAAAGRLLSRLERSESALRLVLTGAARRMQPWVERVDLLATAHEVAPLLERFAQAPAVAEVLARDGASAEVRLEDGTRARLVVLADESELPGAWVRGTGPAEHVAALEAHAARRGLVFEGHQLLGREGPLALVEEHDLYAALDLPWCPPERRSAVLLEAPDDALLAMGAVRGVAGLATRAGHGRYSLPEMAARAEREGYAWALVLDDAPPQALAALLEAAQAWNDAPEHALRVQVATDARIDATGGLHGPLAHAPGADALLCVASLAPEGPVDGASLGERLLRAARDPRVDGVSLRLPAGAGPLAPEALVRELAALGTALWVPPPPWHAEPEPALLRAAVEAGVPLLLSAEARDLVSVDDLILSVGLARRAGAPAAGVLNTRELPALFAHAAQRRRRRGAS